MDILRRFNGDEQTKQALLEFIHAVINDEALDKMYKRIDVSHISDAKELIDKAFDELNNQYGIKEQPAANTNQAR